MQPQHLIQLLLRFCKWLVLVARLFGGGWASQPYESSHMSVISCVSLTADAGGAQSSSVLGPAAQEEPTSHAQFQACDRSN